jgi:DnaJ-domain-containing protein 1
MGKIFLSYARADDEPFVKQLYQDLTKKGIDVWWDRKAMESRGRTFLQELRDAIEGLDHLIAVIGPNFQKEQPYNEAREDLLGILAMQVTELGSFLTKIPTLFQYCPRRN